MVMLVAFLNVLNAMAVYMTIDPKIKNVWPTGSGPCPSINVLTNHVAGFTGLILHPAAILMPLLLPALGIVSNATSLVTGPATVPMLRLLALEMRMVAVLVMEAAAAAAAAAAIFPLRLGKV